jgi:hypothetical protein
MGRKRREIKRKLKTRRRRGNNKRIKEQKLRRNIRR